MAASMLASRNLVLHLFHAHVSPQCGEVEIVFLEQRLQSSEALAELGEHQHLRGESVSASQTGMGCISAS